MEGFSGGLRLVGLDDFIAPPQNCIKPLTPSNNSDEKDAKRAKISLDDDVPVQIQPSPAQRKPLETAKITLNDCLACSGCITSAESVLITAQSQTEFFSKINSKSLDKRIVVISISPQARVSLAVKFGISADTCAKKLVTFFKTLGADYVFDTTFAREFSVIESMAEFVARYRKQSSLPLPMLASACPGWVCYAEKAHGDYVLPYISTAKSPQQVMGTLVKYHFGNQLGLPANQIYHVCIMPCYDKKLEASRNDFFNAELQTRDVDCVLTSLEILEIIRDQGIDFSNLPETSPSPQYTLQDSSGRLLGTAGGSGGYLECVFKYAAKELFGKEVTEIEYQVGRNADLKIAKLEINGEVVLQFAAMYGFRNIQNLVRTIKRGKCPYHFVEVMACPSGCLNGGGQIKAEKPETSKQLVEKLEKTYREIPRSVSPEENSMVRKIYEEWMGAGALPYSDVARKVLHTQYHATQKSTGTALSIQW